MLPATKPSGKRTLAGTSKDSENVTKDSSLVRAEARMIGQNDRNVNNLPMRELVLATKKTNVGDAGI